MQLNWATINVINYTCTFPEMPSQKFYWVKGLQEPQIDVNHKVYQSSLGSLNIISFNLI